MGLDMYLTGRLYFGGKYNKKNDTIILKKNRNLEDKEVVIEIETKDIDSIVIELGYWRKANAIHKWFVDKCFDGNYEDYHGEEIYVYKEHLLELKDLCILVKEKLKSAKDIQEKLNIIQSNLPMQDGFFFGYRDDATGIKWYEEDLDNTIEIIDKYAEKIKKYGSLDLYYSASW